MFLFLHNLVLVPLGPSGKGFIRRLKDVLRTGQPNRIIKIMDFHDNRDTEKISKLKRRLFEENSNDLAANNSEILFDSTLPTSSKQELLEDEQIDPWDNDEQSDYIPMSSSESDSEVEYPVKKKREWKRIFNRRRQDENRKNLQAFNHAESKMTKSRNTKKKHACLYCGKLIKNITRHLMNIHKNEEKVMEALAIKKPAEKRRFSGLSLLRRDGDYNHHKKEDKKIVVREVKHTNKIIACPYCKGFYSSVSISRHVRTYCKAGGVDRVKNVRGFGRVIGSNINEEAREELLLHIFPYITKEEHRKVIFKDAVAISFGNLLIEKYFLTNLGGKHIHISQQLRLLADLFNIFHKNVPEVDNIRDMFFPKYYENIVNAIKIRSGYSYSKFKSPSAASSSCTLILKIVDLLKTKAIMCVNTEWQTHLEKLDFLLKKNMNNFITKMVGENRAEYQRQKVERLPTTAEVKKLMECLDQEYSEAFSAAKSCFNRKTYGRLCKAILVYIMVFNRKRPGDCQKTLVAEYESISHVGEDHLRKLNPEDKLVAAKFSRFLSQGKLNKKISNILPNHLKNGIDLLLHKRSEVGVDEINEKYLFANPSSKRFPFFRADEALTQICYQYQLDAPSLTANKLRKHLATNTSTLPSDTQLIVSDFMGHSMNVHKDIYQQKQANIEIVTVGKLLEECAGMAPNNLPVGEVPKETNQILALRNKKVLMEVRSGNNAYVQDEDKIKSEQCVETEINASGYETKIGVPNSEIGDSPGYSGNTRKFNSRVRKRNSLNSKKSKWNQENEITRSQKGWSTPQKNNVRSLFGEFIESGKVPTIKTIQDIIVESRITFDRSLQGIRSWIINSIRKKKMSRAHPNIKLFITHAGQGSVLETIDRGVPALMIPTFADQFNNAHHCLAKGFALKLSYSDKNFTEETLYSMIKELLNNPVYKEKAKEISKLHHDRPMKPLETAVYWVEYVIRHKGADHLKVAAIHLPWYKLYMVDVWLFIGFVVVAISYAITLLLKLVFHKCNLSNSQKIKKH